MGYGNNGNDLGGQDNNQQQGHAGGLGGVAQDLGISSSYQANAPSAQPYNNYTGNAASNASGYQQQAQAAQGRTAPTINNQFQGASQAGLAGNQGEFGSLIGSLNNDIANPYDSVAVNQFQHGLDQSIAAQQAAANSAGGGAVAQAGAQRAAAQQGVQSQAAATSQAAQIAEQDRFAAIQAAGGLNNMSGQLGMSQYQLEQQAAEQQAQLQLQQGQINNQYSLGLGTLAGQQTGQQLQGMNDYNTLQQGAQKINSNTADNAAAGGSQLFGAGVNAAGQLLGGGAGIWGGGGGAGAAGAAGGGESAGAAAGGIPPVYSDPDLKNDMHADNRMVDEFLAHVNPKSFSYKSATHEPTSRPNGGTYLGVSADDVQSAPGIGRQLVTETPDGKMLEGGATLSALLAGVGRIHERLEGVEMAAKKGARNA